jgi:hypothetical protein
MEAPVLGAVGLAALGYMSYKTALQNSIDEAVALTSKVQGAFDVSLLNS